MVGWFGTKLVMRGVIGLQVRVGSLWVQGKAQIGGHSEQTGLCINGPFLRRSIYSTSPRPRLEMNYYYCRVAAITYSAPPSNLHANPQ
jgi:hypothetical protein